MRCVCEVYVFLIDFYAYFLQVISYLHDSTMILKYIKFIIIAVIIFCSLLLYNHLNPVISVQPINIYHKQSLNCNSQTYKFVPLPQSVIDGVKYFVYFVGRAHSGHSTIASILDSHPHMIVAHEAQLFRDLQHDPTCYTNKAGVFNELWGNSYNSTHCIGGVRSSSAHTMRNKGYSLQIKGLHQGSYISHVDVIGDKNAGHTSFVMNHKSLEWDKLFSRLKSLVNIPFKVIYVIRNPFDSIVSAQLYHLKSYKISSVRKSNETLDIGDDTGLAYQIDKHFAIHKGIMDAKERYNLDMLEVHSKDLVEHPNATITKLCDFLGVSCSDTYIKGCSDTLFKTESKTRYKAQWTKNLISKVEDYILKYDNLLRYRSFDS